MPVLRRRYDLRVELSGHDGVGRTVTLDPQWPSQLLPICDWGCANWSCLDSRAADGAIVTLAGEQGFMNTGMTLRSWLGAWLAGGGPLERDVRAGPDPDGDQPVHEAADRNEDPGQTEGHPVAVVPPAR